MISLFAALYVGLSGSLTLPQGGSAMYRVGGASLRCGYYLTEDFAVEGETAWTEDCAGLAAQCLWHWQGWSGYGDLFGYSRFDPFFTLGAKGWTGRGSGQFGPKAGFGALYHLTDSWSVRADADATLGLDAQTEMVYTVGVGVQYEF